MRSVDEWLRYYLCKKVAKKRNQLIKEAFESERSITLAIELKWKGIEPIVTIREVRDDEKCAEHVFVERFDFE